MKVFGIGLNKTGTTSVSRAVRTLGFRTIHYGYDAACSDVERAELGDLPLLTYLPSGFDAFFDIEALVARYAALDAQYPGSRFVLTTRDLDSWLASRERHVRANIENTARGRYHGRFLEVDLEGWREEWARHHEAVTSHFAGRDEFLVFRVEDGWGPLARLLERPAPRHRRFPVENKSGAGSYRDMAPGARLVRWIDVAWVGARRRADIGRHRTS